ncbi:MAG: hypothetical protein HY585_05320 [Candidatus Omnitrophica bacterium]|nr:hypothetical protein [Candidatus Omnitrophota bacterium]
MRCLKFLLYIFIGWIGVATFSTQLFFWRLEHRLDLKVYRKPFLVLLPGSIHLRPAQLDWHGYFSVRSGSLKVRYPVLLFFKKRYAVSLDGQNLAVEFGPELRKAVGGDQVVFDELKAKVVLGRSRDVGIEFLDAKSKTMQFSLSRLTK